MINGLTPEYLHTLLPPIVQNTTAYNLRNFNDIRNVHARTNLFYNSFLPSTIRAWNELSDEIKSAPSVVSFKFRLNGDLHKPPKYYWLYITTQDHELAKLCMLGFEWSAAHSSHLYKKNIVPSPSCSCGGFESAYQFFFQCPNYSEARRRHLPNNLNDYNTNQLLHGLPDASNIENEVLFTQVQDFIVHSRRFL